jgi:hypothetical protein
MRFLRLIPLLVALTSAAALARGPLDRAEKFRPDVYPSKIQAVDGAARRAVDALNASIDFTERGSTIVVADNAMCGEANEAITGVLTEHFPAAEIVCGAAPAPTTNSADPTKLVTIEASATEAQDTIAGTGVPARVRVRGTVTLNVKGGGVARAFTTKFVDKPWAADFKAWSSERPRRFYLGQTTNVFSSEDDALEAARQAAAKALWDPLRVEMNSRAAAKRSDRVTVSEAFVRRQLESMFRQGKHVEDTFVQCLEGPNGQVWRASILVNASASNVDQIIAHVGQTARAQVAAETARRVERVRGWGSVAAFLAVIVLLYLLVNSLTKGYFVWRLRAGALLLTIAGILVALALT